MAFYKFHQNNSGGQCFKPAYNVFIEADSADEANRRAEVEGILYFDGVMQDRDCRCCGDRWWRASESSSDKFDSKEKAEASIYDWVKEAAERDGVPISRFYTK